MSAVTRATVREVARRAGVSPMTVSRVVNGSRRVRPETRLAVEQVIAAVGYVPNGLARGLTTRKTLALGLIIPDVGNPFYAPIARGAESVARRSGYRVLLCNSESDLSLEGEYIADMLRHRVDGLLIVPVSDAESESVSTSRERRRGYRDALEAAGLPVLPELLVEATVDMQGGYTGINALLKLDPRPTAVFAINNLVAVGAVKALREQGLTVPGDMALVAFDDIEHVAALNPFLTVMPQPAETFGTIAVQLLFDRILGRGQPQPRLVVLPSDVVVRESSGVRLGERST